MRISDWSSDVCSSDLRQGGRLLALPVATPTAREHAQHLDTPGAFEPPRRFGIGLSRLDELQQATIELGDLPRVTVRGLDLRLDAAVAAIAAPTCADDIQRRSEEHTSELQSLMRISYAVFCLKKKKTNKINDRQ